jgi:hypothetical protein
VADHQVVALRSGERFAAPGCSLGLSPEQYIERCTAKLPKLTMETTRRVLPIEATKPLSVVVPDLLYTVVALAPSTGVSEVTMADGRRKDWRELCVAVTNESDPAQLSSLIQELIEALDQGERSWRYIPCPPDALANREAA